MTPVPTNGNDIPPSPGTVTNSPATSATVPMSVSGKHRKLNHSKGRDVKEATVLMTIKSNRTL